MPITTTLALLTAVVFWGFSFVATKYLVSYLTPTEIIGFRLVLGLPPLWLLACFKHRGLLPKSVDWGRLLLLALVLVCHFLIQIKGLNWTSATNTGWLVAVSPLAIALLARAFLGETLLLRQMTGVLVATVGILFLVSGGRFGELGGLANPGDWLALASAFSWAAYTLLVRDISRRRPPLLVTTWVMTLSLVLLSIPFHLSSPWSKFVDLPTGALGALVFLAVGCLALGLWLWQMGVARLGAARAGFFLYLEPLATTLLAAVALGESIGGPGIAGGVLILGGVYLAERRRRVPASSA